MKKTLRGLLIWAERHVRTDLRYVLKSGFWINLNYTLVTFCSLLLSIAFANILSPTQYGTYQYVLSVAGLLSAFTFTGFNTAITRSVARGFDGTLSASMRPQLLWNLVPGLAALAWSAYYALLGQFILALGLLCVGIALPITSAFNSYNAFLIGKKEFRVNSLYLIYGNAAYYACIFLSIFLFPEALLLVAVNLIVNAAASLFFYMKTVRRFRPVGPTDPDSFAYAKQLTFINILATIAGQIDNLLVFHFLGAAELALYSLATIAPERLGGLFKSLTSSAFPKFSEQEHAQIREGINRKAFFMALAIIVCAIAYAVSAPFLFHFLYPAYRSAVPYSQVYALTLIAVVGNLVITAFFAQRKIRELYVLNTAVPAIQITVQVFCTVFWGLWGLVGAKIFSSMFLVAAAFVLIHHGADGSGRTKSR